LKAEKTAQLLLSGASGLKQMSESRMPVGDVKFKISLFNLKASSKNFGRKTGPYVASLKMSLS
jgi:hypothetical protein